MEEITGYVNENDSYELIRANDAVDLVYQVIEDYHAQTGQVLNMKEAADHVESHLEEQAQKLFKLNKFKSRLAPEVEKKEVQMKKESPTLSNEKSAPQISSTGRFTSDDQSKLEAAKLLKWID